MIGAVVLLPAGWFAWAWATYPSDKTPQGAYLRVMSAVNRGQPEAFFAYVETPAQHACYTIARYRKQARERVLRSVTPTGGRPAACSSTSQNAWTWVPSVRLVAVQDARISSWWARGGPEMSP